MRESVALIVTFIILVMVISIVTIPLGGYIMNNVSQIVTQITNLIEFGFILLLIALVGNKEN